MSEDDLPDAACGFTAVRVDGTIHVPPRRTQVLLPTPNLEKFILQVVRPREVSTLHLYGIGYLRPLILIYAVYCVYATPAF